jgi:hypothetical protein
MSVQIVSALLLSFLMVASPFHGATVIIANPSHQSFGEFGHSIDVANGLLVVGAYGDSVDNSSVGKVWIFNARTGSEIRTLVSPNPGYGPGLAGLFGWTVKIADALVIVGAPTEAVNGIPKAGRVYLFNARTGSLVNTLVSPNPENNGFFGSTIGQENGRVYIGASIESVDGVHAAGRVYVFDMKTGTLVTTLVSPYFQVGGVFGISLAVSNGRLIVGALEGPPSCHPTYCSTQGQGRAYVFNATSGSLISTLLPTYQTQFFGDSVAILNQEAFVGADAETVNGLAASGRVYAFNATTGSLIRTIIDPDAEGGARFGVAIKISGDQVIVGAPNEMVNGYYGAGRAYVFNSSTFTLLSTINSPSPSDSARFGSSADITNGHVFIGAPGQTVNGQYDAGTVYIFSGVIGSRSGSDDNQSST